MILVVLASLAVVAYGPIQRKCKIDAAKSQIGLFKTAIATYQVTAEASPSSLQALRYQPPDVEQGKWNGPYLDQDVPPDPWGQRVSVYAPRPA